MTLTAASSYIASDGDLNATLRGAVTAVAFAGVGSLISSYAKDLGALAKPMKILAHGVVGGLSSAAAGGRFESGFVSGGVSAAASSYGVYKALGALDAPQTVGGYAYNAMAASLVGGTSSQLSGGSFENGAITGAFSRLFNDMNHPDSKAPQTAVAGAGVMVASTTAMAEFTAGLAGLGTTLAEWAGAVGAFASSATTLVYTAVIAVGVTSFAQDTGADADRSVPKIKDFWNPDIPPAEDWVWRGKSPVGGSSGAWFNPETGESLHPDLEHGGDIGPHWDHTTKAEGKRGGRRIFPDGTVVPK